MELKDRITYNSEELFQMMEHGLDRLKVFEFDSRYRSLLGESFVSRIGDWSRNIRSRREDPFTLVVCGEFKRGKSSLINALLGEDVTTTNVTTETVTLNHISYGAHSNEAILAGGRRLRLSDEEMQRDRLEELQQQMGEPIRRIELKRPIELLKQITIVDTPGLGDALTDFSEMVEHALRQADAVLYVFSVNYPLSQGEQLFLKTEILTQKYTELFLVGNYADLLGNREDYDRMRAMLEQRVQGLLSGQRPWMLSALDERCAQLGEECPNDTLREVLGAGFADFRRRLGRLITDRRDTVLPDRMQRMLRGMTDELEESLRAMEEGLSMDSRDVHAAMNRVMEQCEEQIQAQESVSGRIDELIRSMQAEAYTWIGGLLDALQQETDTLEDMESSELIKYYSFYCIDTLQEAMDCCMERHTLKLYDELEEVSGELTRNLSRHAARNSYSFRFALDNRTWTKGDSVSYVISRMPLNTWLGIVADGFAGTMRQKEMKKRTPDILREIRAQYSQLRLSALKAVEDSYHGMAQHAKKQLEEYYRLRIDAAKEQAEQSAMVARQDEAQKEEVRRAIGELRAVLADISSMDGGI